MKKVHMNILKSVFLALMLTLLAANCGKGCGKSGSGGGSAAASGAMDLIPSGNNFVAGIDWKKLSTSPLGEAIKKEMPTEMKPLMDGVESATLSFNLQNANKGPENPIIIVSGKLDEAKILEEMGKKEPKPEVEEYEGIKIHKNPSNTEESIAFVQGKLVFSGVENLKKVIDLSKNKGDSLKKNEALMAQMGEVDTGKTLWLVGLVPDGAIPAGAGGPMGQMPKVKAVDLALNYDGGVDLQLGIVGESEEEIKKAQTQADQLKTMGPAFAQGQPELAKVFENIKVDSKGARLIVSLKLDQDTVKKLEELAKK